MEYNQFLLKIQLEVQKQLGNGFHVRVQRVVKNNDTLLDGLIIRKEQEQLAPTIYLNPYFEDFKRQPDMGVQEIISRILCVYKQSEAVSFKNGKLEELDEFRHLRKSVVYKLINRESNQELLKEVPYVEFLDLAIVFYLILEETRNGQMTALIHTSHMTSWGTTKEELYQLAKKNTPELLPVRIKTMKEVLKNLLKENMWDIGEDDDEMMDELLGEERIPIYVLTNERQVNGACCLLYEDCFSKFAKEQEADLIILPSSIHETLLIPEREETSYEELSSMVTEINQNEVPEEDRLSNQIYRYSRSLGTIEIMFHSNKDLIARKE